MKLKPSRLLTCLAGLLVGYLLSAGVILLMLTARSNYLSATLGYATAAVDVADSEIYKTLEEADKAIHTCNTIKAIDLIIPEIENWISPIDKGTGYQLLAVAEYNMGHPQQAIPYAKKWSNTIQARLVLCCSVRLTRRQAILKCAQHLSADPGPGGGDQ